MREFDGRPEKSAYGLDHRGYTYTEALNRDEKAPGRVLINRELERSREAYGRRERDEAGKVKSTVGRAFNFFGKSISDKNAAKAAERRRSLAVERFRAIDVDGSQTISKREITAGAEVLGMTVTRAVEWWDDLNRETGSTGEVGAQPLGALEVRGGVRWF